MIEIMNDLVLLTRHAKHLVLDTAVCLYDDVDVDALIGFHGCSASNALVV